MSRLAVVTACIAIALAVVGCQSNDDSDDTADAFVTDRNAAFNVDVGEEFTIVLESNPSTGYRWELSDKPPRDVIRLVADVYLEPAVEPDEPLVGAAGTQHLTFEAVGEGSTYVQLWYVRSLDPPDPADRAQFEVIVGSGRPADDPGPSEGDTPQPTIVDDEDSMSVAELLATEPSGIVVVRGLFFDDGGGARLCEVLAESFPPQCNQESVPIVNPEVLQLDLAQSGSVRWSDQPVVLVGSLVDGRLVVDE